jgi:hypothetical protein
MLVYDLRKKLTYPAISNSMRARWSGHVSRMGKMKNASTFLLKSLKGRDYPEDLNADDRITDY